MIRKLVDAAPPPALPVVAPEDLERAIDEACRAAPRPDSMLPARFCPICDRQLLDEELTCPPCWLRGGPGKTGFVRAAIASITAVLKR
ncbi:MAG: hypothetical protein WC729_10740 [Sphingomonas sp.]|jgi:hypothetical protein|uniref:hypothetical protein n=1 Tax=Sphingomonas sp. TaxID=28214 RepID=UPI003563BBA1